MWEVLEEMERDWSVFVHLEDPVLETVIAQRDMFPGQGLLATRLIETGQRLTDRFALRIPDTAVAPAELSLTVGVYDLATGERMGVVGGGDSVTVAQLLLESDGGDIPNPISVDFESELELVGFEIDRRRLAPSEPLSLRLYWESQQLLATDYTFFAQLVDADTTRWASQDIPLETSSWLPGDIQTTDFQLLVDEHTPAGVYPLIIGAYTRSADGGFDRLQTLTDEGRLTDDFLALTHIRVD